jgi:putative Ca2+/H+ antiporter (TMEM165/GDT1 family)
MDWRLLLTTFSTVFLAELGDKTQLATLGFAAEARGSRWTVFAGSASALVCSSLLAVLAGGLIAQHLPPQHLRRGSAILFIALGVWTLARS